VRALSPQQHVRVELAGGTYRLQETWTLGPEDAGRGGFTVTYAGVEGQDAVLSGGIPVTGWQRVQGRLFRANVGEDPRLRGARQIYVNGVRERRARGMEAAATGWVKQGDYSRGGFDTGDDGPAASWNFGHPELLEVVGFAQWKSFRCPVDTIEGDLLRMQQPAWSNTQFQTPSPVLTSVAWLENAFELLDRPGDWYLHAPTGELFYLAHDHEIDRDDLLAEVVVPRLDVLVEARGNLDDPLVGLRFENLTFADSGWPGPSSPQGYGPVQAGATFLDSDRCEQGVWATQPFEEWGTAPAALTIECAQAVQVDSCTFTRLGSHGLHLCGGHRDDPGSTVTRCRFRDISGCALVIGGLTPVIQAGARGEDDRRIMSNIVISHNQFTDVAVEYPNCVGIWATYARRLEIVENELFDLPYTAISVGWGWGTADPTEAGQNRIVGNHIHHVMQELADGAGIYTLGAQPGSVIADNYLHDIGNERSHEIPVWGGIYLDSHSSGFQITGNVVTDLVDAPSAHDQDQTWCFWLLLQKTKLGGARDNQISGNFSDIRNVYCDPEDEIDRGPNRYEPPEQPPWPPQAGATISRARSLSEIF
jgi:hypothetical protein